MFNFNYFDSCSFVFICMTEIREDNEVQNVESVSLGHTVDNYVRLKYCARQLAS